MPDAGFEILAFPCNQFGGQEPGTNEEILETACTRFKAEYPIFDKVIELPIAQCSFPLRLTMLSRKNVKIQEGPTTTNRCHSIMHTSIKTRERVNSYSLNSLKKCVVYSVYLCFIIHMTRLAINCSCLIPNVYDVFPYCE